MDHRDPRAVLGLPLHATRAEAQRAFRRMAKQTHPDAGGDAAAFRALVAAWAELAPLLAPDPSPVAAGGVAPEPGRWAAPVAPHLAAYGPPVTGRVVWAERRPPVCPVRPDFATMLEAEMARLAA